MLQSNVCLKMRFLCSSVRTVRAGIRFLAGVNTQVSRETVIVTCVVATLTADKTRASHQGAGCTDDAAAVWHLQEETRLL